MPYKWNPFTGVLDRESQVSFSNAGSTFSIDIVNSDLIIPVNQQMIVMDSIEIEPGISLILEGKLCLI
jgi:hypothetical protein